MVDAGYSSRDRSVWNGIFERMSEDWFAAPPSDAMHACRKYFEGCPRRRLLDLGCGFGRWARDLAGRCAEEVVGIDYAESGIRAASAWARRDAFRARFVVASAVALPFRAGVFDGVVAALLLDNLSRADCRRAVEELDHALQPGARGFFVFSPIVSPCDASAVADNPTVGCMHVPYDDSELPDCLPGWFLTRVGASREGLRLVEAVRREGS